MAANDDRVHPNQSFSTLVLTDTPLDVGAASTRVVANNIVLTGGAAIEIVVFANSAGSAYFSVLLPIGAVINIGGFDFNNTGLEVDTASSAGDVGVFISFSQ